MAFKMKGFPLRSGFKQNDDDYKAFFPKHKEISGDIVSGLDSKDDLYSDIISAKYRSNKQKEKGNPRGASMIMQAQKENIKDYERKYQESLDLDYLKKLSDQYIKSMEK